jgi:hypothetical protein
MEDDYVYFVHILGREERILGARTTHPGLGRYPTRRWVPGDRFCDVVDIDIEAGTPTPAVYDIEVGWHRPGSEERLPVHAPDGSPLELVLLDRVKIVPEHYPPVAIPKRVEVNLGGEITLLGYGAEALQASPGETLQITLFWEAKRAPTHDYTVFLHLAAANGPPHAQHDSQPREETYPTSFWEEGEVVTEIRAISIPSELPPGEYPLVAGMYVLATGERLPRLGPDGGVNGYDVHLGTVAVHPDDS